MLYKSSVLTTIILLSLLFLPSCSQEDQEEAPNVLWITCEDINPFLGAYGDQLAYTPNLDQLAREGVIYTNAYATAPVCSPSRSCLITGVYATSLGTQHLRSTVEIPEFIKLYPEYLREQGYYCTNKGKEDYNFKVKEVWDESSDKAHWRNRPAGQAFFSVFNIGTTHQSQIFGSDEVYQERYGKRLSENLKQKPEEMIVPPYHFDAPEVRKLWARYYDQVTIMDQEVGDLLQQLEEDGLTDNTIIFFYSDHGTGMPRSKRALYDSGLKVPLIIKAPEKYQKLLGLTPGTTNDELVHFVDFPPTLLNMLGIEIPDYMQGIPFLGPNKQSQTYVYGHADRVDEAYELSRTARGKRYRYIRNYLPHLPLIQDNFYTDQSEIMIALRRLKAQGELNAAQESMWKEKRSVEELYDTETDPFEVNNLAGQPEYEETLKEMRVSLNAWVQKTKDSGFFFESQMHKIGESSTIYETLQKDEDKAMENILALTDLMYEEEINGESILPYLKAKEAYLRYWAAIVLRDRAFETEVKVALEALLKDSELSVKLTAAQTLCVAGYCEQSLVSILEALQSEDKMIRLYAARIFEELEEKAVPILDKVREKTAELCPIEDWSKYYELYTCWALQEALKKQTLN